MSKDGSRNRDEPRLQVIAADLYHKFRSDPSKTYGLVFNVDLDAQEILLDLWAR